MHPGHLQCCRYRGAEGFCRRIYKRYLATMAASEMKGEETIKRRFPKVQLHIHLDGAARHSTLWEIAKKRHINVPGTTLEEFTQSLQNWEKGDLGKFLSNFSIFLPIIAGNKEALNRVAYELCEDQAREGVVYFEARYNPHFLANSPEVPLIWGQTPGDLTPRDVVIAVNDGISRGCRDFGVKGRTILCMIWTNPEFSRNVVELSKEFQNDTVVGVDIAGNEHVPCHQAHIDAFKMARDLGVHRTVHAGELGPAENVKRAIEEMHAERIGHGYQIINDKAIYQMVKDRFIHLELCPTSSTYTGAWTESLADHCAKRFIKDGFNIGLNTDDPTIFFNTMEGEYQIARDHFKMDDVQLAKLTVNAARASFLPEDDKKQLVQELEVEFNSFHLK